MEADQHLQSSSTVQVSGTRNLQNFVFLGACLHNYDAQPESTEAFC